MPASDFELETTKVILSSAPGNERIGPTTRKAVGPPTYFGYSLVRVLPRAFFRVEGSMASGERREANLGCRLS